MDNSGAVNDQPQVTTTDGGGFAIVYRNSNAPGGSGNDITLARYDSAGNLLTSTLVNQFGDTAGNQSEPSRRHIHPDRRDQSMADPLRPWRPG